MYTEVSIPILNVSSLKVNVLDSLAKAKYEVKNDLN